jgi:hypothetical protein
MIPHNSITGSLFSRISSPSSKVAILLILAISLWAGSVFAQSLPSVSVEEEIEGELDILSLFTVVGDR